MYFEDVRQWQGTADGLTKELKRQAEQLGLSVEPPALRTVRQWRAKQLLSQGKGEKFGFRQILEGLATTILLKRGWTLVAIAEVLPSFSNMALEQQIIAETNNQDPTWSPALQTAILPLPTGHASKPDLAENAVVLFAQGIIRQYTRVLNEEIVSQEDRMPSELHRAMCKLGRLYIEEGKADKAACIHTILERARYPLSADEWELEIFRHPDFRFRQATLIEPELRVPTSDCAEIANSTGAFGEDNVIQRNLYERLIQITEQLGSRRQHKAYTAIREMFGRRSLIGEYQLLDYIEENELTPVQGKIIEAFFDRVQDIWLIDGLAHRCGYCGTLLRPHPNQKRFPLGRCPIRQCENYEPREAKVSEKLDPKKEPLLIAKPQILTYWTGPGIDEIAIFDVARKNGLDTELYPDSDKCDIGVNGRSIGIDAKSYTSPVSLGLRLNRSIGGLKYYRRRIIAVSDRLVRDNPDYLSSLESTLEKKGDAATLEVCTVSEVIQLLVGLTQRNPISTSNPCVEQ
ncbi:MAG: hypothetical protein QNJ68_02210 [Microcoleaceae cyanobacterium MO_207.B10]|nr:hypothetical protein [Microcoleaceae cyanobacterium MO_207.B10]